MTSENYDNIFILSWINLSIFYNLLNLYPHMLYKTRRIKRLRRTIISTVKTLYQKGETKILRNETARPRCGKLGRLIVGVYKSLTDT
jgi:hypothetical protein